MGLARSESAQRPSASVRRETAKPRVKAHATAGSFTLGTGSLQDTVDTVGR